MKSKYAIISIEQFGELISQCPLSIRMTETHILVQKKENKMNESEKRHGNKLIKYTCVESSSNLGRKSSTVADSLKSGTFLMEAFKQTSI